MAPTVCLMEQQHMYIHRKQRAQSNGNCAGLIIKYRQTSKEGSIVPSLASLESPESAFTETAPVDVINSCLPALLNFSSPNISARVSTDDHDRWNKFLTRRRGLLTIIVRTMALVRRNHLLQQRVNALQAETRDFIHSVLNNPENMCRKQYYRQQQSQKLVATQYKDVTISSKAAVNYTIIASPDLTSSTVHHSFSKSKCDTNNGMVLFDSTDSDISR